MKSNIESLMMSFSSHQSICFYLLLKRLYSGSLLLVVLFICLFTYLLTYYRSEEMEGAQKSAESTETTPLELTNVYRVYLWYLNCLQQFGLFQ